MSSSLTTLNTTSNQLFDTQSQINLGLLSTLNANILPNQNDNSNNSFSQVNLNLNNNSLNLLPNSSLNSNLNSHFNSNLLSNSALTTGSLDLNGLNSHLLPLNNQFNNPATTHINTSCSSINTATSLTNSLAPLLNPGLNANPGTIIDPLNNNSFNPNSGIPNSGANNQMPLHPQPPPGHLPPGQMIDLQMLNGTIQTQHQGQQPGQQQQQMFSSLPPYGIQPKEEPRPQPIIQKIKSGK